MRAMSHPVLTLSPASCISQSYCSETTPKLTPRARRESFSRLLAPNRFPNWSDDVSIIKEGGRSRRGRRCDFGDTPPPTIHISPPELETELLLNVNDKNFLDSGFLPFSPQLLNCKSPQYISPNYRSPTPTKSPLYAPEPKSVFLGRGSFGNVRLCTYKGARFALKVSRGGASGVGERHLLGIRHPHLVRVLHVSTLLRDVTVFVCMEFAGHCNLQQLLDTRSELHFPKRLSFCIQVTSGLRHLHRNYIVHGDIKPANVLVNPFGICKIGDFGQSFRLDDKPDVVSRTVPEVVGTACYAAPEVLRGATPTPASDIYSLGVFLWQVYTKEMPFAGEHPHVIIYKVAHYGARPVFESGETGIIESYFKLAEHCWCEDPLSRCEASQVLERLQKLSNDLKKQNVNVKAFKDCNFKKS